MFIFLIQKFNFQQNQLLMMCDSIPIQYANMFDPLDTQKFKKMKCPTRSIAIKLLSLDFHRIHLPP